MLGLLALGLITIMIYTLVKNALLGKQLSKNDQYNGTIELIIPVTATSEVFLEAWQKNLSSFPFLPDQVKIHILVDGHHPTLNDWQTLASTIPYLEIHNFPMRPTHLGPVAWMLDQIATKIQGNIVIIGDANLVPTGNAFLSVAKTVAEKGRSYFIVPQTAKFHILGEAISVLNPTLAFASFFGFKKWRRNISHPLLGISEGWMAMTHETFKQLSFKSIKVESWKAAISKQWDEQNKTYHLAFGEKNLLRFYPTDVKELFQKLHDDWGILWIKRDRMGFWLFLIALFLWSFPVVCLLTHPFWAIASFFLLVLYRFFSKIVFQESWISIALHPVACVAWIGSFLWFVTDLVKAKNLSRKTKRVN
jgi:hypothetical protein